MKNGIQRMDGERRGPSCVSCSCIDTFPSSFPTIRYILAEYGGMNALLLMRVGTRKPSRRMWKNLRS
jgi:hypothetical protein